MNVRLNAGCRALACNHPTKGSDLEKRIEAKGVDVGQGLTLSQPFKEILLWLA